MALYVVSYDLLDRARDYGALIASLKAVSPNWCHALDRIWLIEHAGPASAVPASRPGGLPLRRPRHRRRGVAGGSRERVAVDSHRLLGVPAVDANAQHVARVRRRA
jgi:hypothetical protein